MNDGAVRSRGKLQAKWIGKVAARAGEGDLGPKPRSTGRIGPAGRWPQHGTGNGRLPPHAAAGDVGGQPDGGEFRDDFARGTHEGEEAARRVEAEIGMEMSQIVRAILAGSEDDY